VGLVREEVLGGILYTGYARNCIVPQVTVMFLPTPDSPACGVQANVLVV